jgi:hypothetical protein
VNGLQVGEVVVIEVNTEAEEQTSIASVYNLEITKLKDISAVDTTEPATCYLPYSGLHSRGVYFAERAQFANFETNLLKVGVV